MSCELYTVYSVEEVMGSEIGGGLMSSTCQTYGVFSSLEKAVKELNNLLPIIVTGKASPIFLQDVKFYNDRLVTTDSALVYSRESDSGVFTGEKKTKVSIYIQYFILDEVLM